MVCNASVPAASLTLSDTQSGKYRLHAGVAKLLYLAFSGTDVLLDAVWHQGMLYVVYM